MIKYLLITISLFQLIQCSSSSWGQKKDIPSYAKDSKESNSSKRSYNSNATPQENVRSIWNQGCPKETNVSKGPSDGRFTIGIGSGSASKRLMYGYPSPRSTSYFVLKIGDRFASNNPSFCEATYISGTEEIDYYTGINLVKYNFLDVEVEQLLIPTNEKLEHVTSEISPKYYRIEYNLINKSTSNQSVSLAVLIDIMIADNDGPKVAIYKENKKLLTPMEEEVSLSGGDVPKGVMLFHNGTNASGLTGDLIVRDGTNSPDELLLGSWPYFISSAWGITPRKTMYTDSAVLMRWNDKAINTNETKTFYFFYGFANNSKEGLDVLLNDDKIKASNSQVNYEKNAVDLTDDQKKYIDEKIQAAKKFDISQVTIEGFADANGADDVNESISKLRALNVQDYIVKKHRIRKEKIVIKPVSSSMASKRDQDIESGNPEDRKVVMNVFTLDKKINTPDNAVIISKKNFKTIAEQGRECIFVYKNGQSKKGKLIKMKRISVSANIDNAFLEISKKELKTITPIR